MGKPTNRWISVGRVWDNCFILGLGVGWDTEDRTACVLIQFGRYLLMVGPHHRHE